MQIQSRRVTRNGGPEAREEGRRLTAQIALCEMLYRSVAFEQIKNISMTQQTGALFHNVSECKLEQMLIGYAIKFTKQIKQNLLGSRSLCGAIEYITYKELLSIFVHIYRIIRRMDVPFKKLPMLAAEADCQYFHITL